MMAGEIGRENAVKLLKNLGVEKCVGIISYAGPEEMMRLCKQIDVDRLVILGHALTLPQAKKWIRKRGLNDLVPLVHSVGVDNILVLLESLGFSKSLELVELLGVDKLIELTHKIGKMKFPHYNKEHRAKRKHTAEYNAIPVN